MDRLTGRNEHGGIISLITDVHPDVERVRLLHKLAAYEDAEEQGRLVIGKFRIGAEVWATNDRIIHGVIAGYSHTSEPVSMITMCDQPNQWGWYADRYIHGAEAEAALALST